MNMSSARYTELRAKFGGRNPNAVSVVVRRPLGVDSFARAYADCFAQGVLTVTCQDTGREIRTFGPQDWTAAETYDGRDYPLAIFQNPRTA